MFKIGKKILCTLLVVVMCLTSMPLEGFADLEILNPFSGLLAYAEEVLQDNETESKTEPDDVTWTFNEEIGELRISGTGEMKNYTDAINDLSEIEAQIPWFSHRNEITSIVVDEGITHIGDCAFAYLSNVKSVSLPSTLVSIGDMAFAYMFDLNNIAIPEGVKEIGNYAFLMFGCESVTIPSTLETVGEDCFVGASLANITNNSKNIISISNNNGFCEDYAIHKIYLTYEEAMNICEVEDAFGYSNTTEDVLNLFNERLNKKGLETFNSIDSVNEWFDVYSETFNLEYYPDWFVVSCYSDSVEHESVKKRHIKHTIIDNENAECECFKYSGVYGEITWSVDKETKILNVGGTGTLDNTVSDADWKYLRKYYNSVVIEENASIPEVEISVFGQIDKLAVNANVTSITNDYGYWPEFVVAEDNSAYTVMDGVLYDKEFTKIIAYSEKLEGEDYIIPATVVEIGKGAFARVKNLKNISYEEDSALISIDSFAFSNSSIETINLPATIEYFDADSTFDNMSLLKAINIAQGSELFSSEDGVLFAENNTYLIKYPSCKEDAEYQIPNTVTTIYNKAFIDSSNLKTITFEDNSTLEYIGTEAFACCSSLDSIDIPASVLAILEGAFSDCTSLTRITVNNPDCILADEEGTIYEGADIYGYIGSSANSYADNHYRDFYDIETGRLIANLNGIYYGENSDGTVSVFGYENSNSDKAACLIIPNKIHGKQVTTVGHSINSLVYSFKKLNCVVIPESVTSIEGNAFKNCALLETVNIPSTVTSIGASAFLDCTALSEVIIAEDSQLTTIGGSTFKGCGSLAELELPESVTTIGGSFIEGTAIKYLRIPRNVTSMATKQILSSKYTSSLAGAAQLEKVEFAEGMTTIPEYALYNCNTIKSVTIPSTVTGFGSKSFNGTTGLNRLDISNLTMWASFMFSDPADNPLTNAHNLYVNNELLDSLVIDETFSNIGGNAFSGCTSLKSLTFGADSKINNVGKDAFSSCTSLESVAFVEGCNPINFELGAFKDCVNIAIVNAPSLDFWLSLSFGTEVASGGNSLVSIPELQGEGSNPTEFAHNLYIDGNLLEYLVIPKNIQELSAYAFVNCESIKQVVFEEGSKMTWINKKAFSGCSSIEELTLPENVEELDSSFIAGTQISKITVPNSVNKMGSYVYKYSIVSLNCVRDSCFYGAEYLKEVVFEQGIEEIPFGALMNCVGVENVTIPSSVTNIRWRAFEGCSNLKEIILPSKLTNIGDRAFNGCSSLKEIVIPENVKTIRISAFENCGNIETIIFSGNSILEEIGKAAFKNCALINEFDIPNNVKTIGAQAFSGTGITEITVPKSVTLLGDSTDYSFVNGATSLKKVVFEDGLTKIPDYALAKCSSVEKVEIPTTVSEIGTNAFTECSALKSLTLLENVETIGATALPTHSNFVLYCYPNSVAETYAINNNIKYEMPPTSEAITLKVFGSDGVELKTGYNVNWYKDGSKIASGKTLKSYNDDSTYSYEIILSNDLSEKYYEPLRKSFTASNALELTYTLNEIETINVSGKVISSSDEGFEAVTIKFTQRISGSKSKTVEVVADSTGAYSATLLKVTTDVRVSAAGFKDKVLRNISDNFVADSVALDDVVIEKISGNKIALSLSMKKASTTQDTSAVENIKDLNNIEFALFNVTQNKEISSFSVQYPYILFDDVTILPGDEIRITATDKLGKMIATTVSCILDEDNNGAATIQFVQNGTFTVENINADFATIVLLFDADGNYVTTIDITNGVVSEPLGDGSYKLVFMSDNDLLRKTSNYDVLTKSGLVEGIDFASKDVEITSGVSAVISDVTVPNFDESKFKYTDSDYTEFAVNKTTISAGKLVTLKLQYKIEEKYNTSAQKVVFELPVNATLIENSVTLNGVACNYELDGTTLSVYTNLSEAVVRCCITPLVGGEYVLDAHLSFDNEGNNIIQPIGSVTLNATDMTFEVPETTAKKDLSLSGIAIPNATIKIYDNDHLIGECISNKAGSWNAYVKLHEATDYTYHNIYATAESTYGYVARTLSYEVFYNESLFEVSKVTMINTAWRRVENITVVDFLNPSTKKLSYDYYSAYPTFTFKVKMTTDNADLLGNVYVITTDKNGRDTKVKCTYDSKTGLWIGKHDYRTAAVKPMGVTVEYELAPNNKKTLTEKYISTCEDVSLNIPLIRYYNSDSDFFENKGMFGYGWKTDYEISVAISENRNEAIVIHPAQYIYLKKTGDEFLSVTDKNVKGKLINDKFNLYLADGTTLCFTKEGYIESQIEANGYKIAYDYENGRLASVVDNFNNSINFVYENDKVIKTIAGDKVVIYEYDGDYLVKVTTANGSVLYEYNVNGRDGSRSALTKITEDGIESYLCYDSYGRLISVSNSDNTSYVTYTYVNNYVVDVRDSEDNTTRYEYDTEGFLIAKTLPNGSKEYKTYTEDGKVKTLSSNSKTIYEYSYDDYGNMYNVKLADGNDMYFEYDENGNLKKLTDPKDVDTQYEYDEKGNIKKIIYCDNTYEAFDYNSIGNVIRYTDRSGNVTQYEYDSNDRTKSMKLSDGTLVEYTYDSNDNLIRVKENGETTNMSYDEYGNVVKIIYPNSRFIEYTYNFDGQITSITDSEGNVTNYLYDEINRLAKLTDKSGNLIVEYKYNSNNTPAKQINANGTYTEYDYTDGYINSIINYSAENEVISRFSYTYNSDGNIVKMIDESGTWLYEYDELSQLIKTIAPDGKITEYIYDANGNRVSVIDDGELTKYVSNNLNQYVSMNDTNFTYDVTGNLIESKDANGIKKYCYDSRNRLVRYEDGNDVYEYEYDVFGNKSATVLNGIRTEYVSSPVGAEMLLTSYDSDGKATSYIQGSGLVAQKNEDDTYYYNYNILGSTSEITNSNGEMVNSYNYAPNGKITNAEVQLNNIFTYAGKYGIVDDGNGLYYTRDRFVDVDTLSFISVDRSRQQYDVNMYRYANNNPINYIDLNGELGVLAVLAIGAAIGAGCELIKDTVTYVASGGEINEFSLGGTVGAAVGGFVTTGCALVGVGPIVSNMAGAEVSTAIEGWIDNGRVDCGDMLENTIWSAVGGAIADGVTVSSNGVVYNDLYMKSVTGKLLKNNTNFTFKTLVKYGISDFMKGNFITLPLDVLSGTILSGDALISYIKAIKQLVYGIDDPSGYVYEAVPSNRVEGVTATAYTIEEYYDEFDELQKDIVLWDATEFDQENPLITDAEGRYAWDVPAGKWQVKYEKENYVTTYSEWLDVPPPQTEVNVEIVSTLAPEVKEVYAYDDYVEVTFSQYMTLDTANKISVLQDGTNEQGVVSAVNSEDNGKGIQYASIFRFAPADGSMTDKVTVKVSDAVNYAGTTMAADYSEAHNVVIRPKNIEIENAISFVEYATKEQIRVKITPDEAAAGKKVIAYSTSPSILAVTDEVITDENGYAIFELSGDLPGTATIVIAVEGTDLEKEFTVEVGDVVETVKTVSASIDDQSEVNYSTKVSLSTETEDATIYYSVNGCEYAEYTEPVELVENVTISVYATKPGYLDSAIATYTYKVKPRECTHNNIDIVEAVDATCEQTGMTEGQICLDCGKMLKTPEVEEAKGHNMTVVIEKNEPTCTEPGSEIVKCSRCDVTETKTIAVSDHDYSDEWTIDKEPTCLVEGLKSHHCSRCESVKDSTIIAATGHSMSGFVITVKPTCTTLGEEKNSCSKCEHFITREIGVIDHTYNAVITDPTCTEDGYTTYTCSVCGDNYTADHKDALKHTGGTANCKDKAVCTRCNTAYGEIDSSNHKNIVTDKAVEATCKAPGLTEGSHCEACGVVIKAQSEIAQLEHNYQAVVTEPTCTEDGYTTYTCSACGDNYTTDHKDALKHTGGTANCKDKAVCTRCNIAYGDLDKNNHKNIVTDKAVGATCKAPGLTEGSHCDACGKVIKAQTTIAKLAHKEVAIPGKAATCKETGVTEGKKCSVCGEITVAQTTIKKLDHSYVDGTCNKCGDTKAANCSHMCHKNNFIWKILRFFFKLFKIQPVCECGVKHY